jgi:hypothetical protein
LHFDFFLVDPLFVGTHMRCDAIVPVNLVLEMEDLLKLNMFPQPQLAHAHAGHGAITVCVLYDLRWPI